MISLYMKEEVMKVEKKNDEKHEIHKTKSTSMPDENPMLLVKTSEMPTKLEVFQNKSKSNEKDENEN